MMFLKEIDFLLAGAAKFDNVSVFVPLAPGSTAGCVVHGGHSEYLDMIARLSVMQYRVESGHDNGNIRREHNE